MHFYSTDLEEISSDYTMDGFVIKEELLSTYKDILNPKYFEKNPRALFDRLFYEAYDGEISLACLDNENFEDRSEDLILSVGTIHSKS